MKLRLIIYVMLKTMFYSSGNCLRTTSAVETLQLDKTQMTISYNDRYNEVVKSSVVSNINEHLPKEAKFFDDFDCK